MTAGGVRAADFNTSELRRCAAGDDLRTQNLSSAALDSDSVAPVQQHQLCPLGDGDGDGGVSAVPPPVPWDAADPTAMAIAAVTARTAVAAVRTDPIMWLPP